MRRIRTFEERVGELFVRQETAGSMLHLSIGEEGAAVGVGAVLRDGDSFTTHHRGHGIFLARGADPNRMMAEIAGKAAGYCAGKGGSMHIADMALGHLGANAIVGGGIPAVVGAGLSYRHHRKPNVSVAFFGDGALQQGILYESMNMAALWRLPVLFVCINNQYGMGTRIDHAAASLAFDERARSFGLLGEIVDGSDVEAVRQAADSLLAAARGGRAGFLAIDCFRFYGHARMDKSPYRSAEEEAAGRARDPLARQHARLVGDGVASEEDLAAIDSAAAAEMDAAVDFAIAAERPEPAALFRDVYGPDQPPPVPLAERLDRVLGARR
ncbi:MAG: thiamine pyrophosphate-dependent dehydrogenase E1 component subunit alpha [Rhodospirillaceae bacterium]|nr:thiamine pyrophosphate-dependent dehydrogenase E1 component subunit alpha [Rhodospirillaceae bacterium]